jgi:hypothetical protein
LSTPGQPSVRSRAVVTQAAGARPSGRFGLGVRARGTVPTVAVERVGQASGLPTSSDPRRQGQPCSAGLGAPKGKARRLVYLV